MNRKLKFRVWDTMLEKMVADQPWLSFDNPEYVFMQFTGFHDETGKEIFEGDTIIMMITDDIVPANNGRRIPGIIEWNHHHGAWQFKADEGGIYSFEPNDNCYVDAVFSIVTGNIFEK